MFSSPYAAQSLSFRSAPAIIIRRADRSSRARANRPPLLSSSLKTFSGKISMSKGKYVLEDAASNTSYVLDNQKKAKQFDGKAVMITGTLDTNKNTIHVRKIEAAG